MILFRVIPYIRTSRPTSKHFLMKKVLIYKNLCKLLPTATTYKLGIWIYISLELNLSNLALILPNLKNVWIFCGHSLASSRNLELPSAESIGFSKCARNGPTRLPLRKTHQISLIGHKHMIKCLLTELYILRKRGKTFGLRSGHTGLAMRSVRMS